MPVIIEGKYRFEFPDADGWHAFKYDEINPVNPGFYGKRIEIVKWKGEDGSPGEGIKAVDIVAGIQPDFQELTLLEVKDFRGDEPRLRIKISTGEMPVEIVLKALHTWGALCLGARCGDTLLAPDLRAGILRPPHRLRLVLFLAQTPIRQSPQEGNTKQKIEMRRKQRLGILTKMQNHLKHLGIQSTLADLGDLPANCGWTVTELS